MNKSNTRVTLDFLKPIDDIAVFHYLIMAGRTRTKSRVKTVMTYNDHKMVSNVLTVLLKCEAFSHVREQLLEDKYKTKIGEWTEGRVDYLKIFDHT